MAKYLSYSGLQKVWAKIKANFVSALGTNGNYLTWTKNGTTNNITVPFATTSSKIGSTTVGSSTRPVYISSGTPTAISYVGDNYLSWGDTAIAGNFTVGDCIFNEYISPNRLSGLKAAGITIEYSRDSGATWVDYGAADISKRRLFTTRTASFKVGGEYTAADKSGCQLRVTIDTSAGGIYTVLYKFHIYLSTNYSQNCKVTIKAALGSSETNFSKVICENQPISGWSGWNVIPIPGGLTTYGNTLSSQYKKIQFTFTQTGLSDTTKTTAGLNVISIFGFGGMGWSTPSNMAMNGHAYSYDGDMSVTFPANITATTTGYGVITALKFVKSGGTSSQFLKADGSVDSNTYAVASNYLALSGGTLTGTVTFNVGADGYADSYTSKGLNMGNSNITGLNSIYTADASDNASEGIHFYRDTTHVDTLWASGGELYFVPNRAIGTGTTAANSNKVIHSGNYTSYVNTTNFPGLNKTGTITKVGTVTSGGVAVSVTSGGATIGTSATTIATIGGVAVQAKIGSYAASGHTHTKILYVDSRSTAVTPTDAVAINGVQLDFKSASVGGLGSSGYNGVLTLDPYSDVSGGYPIQLGWNTSVDGNNTRDICIRTAKSATEWNSWRVIADRELTTSEIETICV